MIARLDRIEAMALARAPAALVLSELELLIPEARRWLEGEGPAAAAARVALERCLLALRESNAGCERRDRDREPFANLPVS